MATIATYDIYINASVIQNMYKLQVDGNNDLFTEEHVNLQGAERGGHFCYKKNDDAYTIEIIGFIQAPLMEGTTSLNSGDFPFTFHTHPIVINLDENVVDNYPNMISPEDLIGSVEDNYYYNSLSNRNICDKSGEINHGGINFFDIVAVPYGLFVYRPNRGHAIMNKPIGTTEQDCQTIFELTVNIFRGYILNNKHMYYNTTANTTKAGIKKYINILQKYGFIVDFFPWENAIANGIMFKNEVPVRSYVDTICMC